MTTASTNSYQADYIEEIKGYIPILQKGTKDLRNNPTDSELLNEIYRLTHIIKGASSMVGVKGPEAVAGCLENLFETIFEGNVPLSEKVITIIEEAYDFIERSVRMLENGTTIDEQSTIDRTAKACSEIIRDHEDTVSTSDSNLASNTEPLEEKSFFNTPGNEFLEDFRLEAEEHLQNLYKSLQLLENEVTSDVAIAKSTRDAVTEIRRAFHTMKGAAAVIGLEIVSGYCHEVEDYFDWLYEKATIITPKGVAGIAAAIDLLAALIENPDFVDVDKLEIVLERLQPLSQESAIPTQTPTTETITPDATSNEFTDGFHVEAEEHFQTLYRALQQLEDSVIEEVPIDGKVSDAIAKIRQAFHSVKGASAVIGLEFVSGFCHEVEDYFDWLHEKAAAITPDEVANIAGGIDMLSALIENPDQIDVARLETILEQLQPTSIGKPALEESTTPKQTVTEALPPNEFIDDFRAEAEEHFQTLYQALQQLENSVTEEVSISGNIREAIAEIRRAFHTVKGASAVIGLANISSYCHEVEDYLDKLYEKTTTITPDRVTGIAGAIDLLASLIESPEQVDSSRKAKVLEVLTTTKLSASTHTSDLAIDNDSTTPPANAKFSTEIDLELELGFRDEAQQHLEDINDALQILGKVFDDDATALSTSQREELGTIRRCVHTIKGAAAVIGFNEIASYTHVVEDFLDWLFKKDRVINKELSSLLVGSLDLLAEIIEESASENTEQQQIIISKINDCLKGKTREVTAEKNTAIAELLVDDKEKKETPPLPVATPKILPEEVVQETSTTLRVNKDHVDSMVNLANELLVGVSAFEQRMSLFREALDELDITRNRLKDIALELETNFEVKALDDLGKKLSRIDETVAALSEDGTSYEEFDSMELDRYTQLNLIIRSLNEATIDVGAIHGGMGMIYSDIDGDINRQRRNIKELQLQVMRTRMSPMSSIIPRLSRTMRDVASKLNKKVRLKVEGEGVELDRVVWEKLADPFMHLVRNAVHHGLENEEERRESKKPSVATLTLSAQRQGNRVVIRFSDDGQGLDFKAIRKKAESFGLRSQAKSMNNKQLADLIFFPGFSTKTISEISGRGVGMDVVKQNIQELQGSISIETTANQGTDFIIYLPLTMGVVKALMIKSNERQYAIPISDIKEIRRIDSADIDTELKEVQLGHERLPYYSFKQLMGLDQIGINDANENPLMLIMDLSGTEIALVVSEIAGQNELVIKNLGAHLKTVQGVSGAALLGDGSLVPILNINELTLSTVESSPQLSLPKELETEKQLTILIVDDSISVRRVVSRLVDSQGWQPIEAKDGQDAIEQLETIDPDFILLDVEMPRMNGFEFLIKKGNMTKKENIPVVMLTSRTSDKHKEKAFSLGADGFLNKPYKDEELIELVEKLTSRQKTEETTS